LLRLAQDHPQIFSKDALARRKQGTEKTPPDWLESYMKHVYAPKPVDFRRLRGYVRKHRNPRGLERLLDALGQSPPSGKRSTGHCSISKITMLIRRAAFGQFES